MGRFQLCLLSLLAIFFISGNIVDKVGVMSSSCLFTYFPKLMNSISVRTRYVISKKIIDQAHDLNVFIFI